MVGMNGRPSHTVDRVSAAVLVDESMTCRRLAIAAFTACPRCVLANFYFEHRVFVHLMNSSEAFAPLDRLQALHVFSEQLFLETPRPVDLTELPMESARNSIAHGDHVTMRVVVLGHGEGGRPRGRGI
jgi:hypothetical protein